MLMRHYYKLIRFLILLVATFAIASTAVAQDQTEHTVQPGENLFRIGLRYGISWTEIAQANGIAGNQIYIGQVLVIPGLNDSAPAATAVPVPTAASAPSTPTIQPTEAAAPTSVPTIAPTAAPAVEASDATHVVQRGETLHRIATSYGTTWQVLADLNQLLDPTRIEVGQVLSLPSGASGNQYSGEIAPAAGEAVKHTVAVGDTLASLALQYGTTIHAITTANSLKNSNFVYVGQRLTIPGGSPLAASTAPVVTAYKSILVDISEQRIYVYEGDAMIWTALVSTGSPGLGTRTGTFYIQSKIPNAYGSTWNIWMPHWLGIYYAGGLENGFHSLPIQPDGSRLWSGYLGTPVSYGCIVLGVVEAERLWMWAEIGTEVNIRY